MEASPGEVTLPFRTLDRMSLRAEEPDLFVARTADQWARLWQRMTSHLSPTPPQPTVDWSTEMVVVLALGTRATGGYTVEIEEIRAGQDTLDVHGREDVPGRTCVVTAALTYPHHAVAVAARNGQARLTLRVVTVECE
ncbi:protease complex subunit PrcB family protein [Micromonospora chersina]|uniref:protease complex subunit PrcB family protein n=1 Tax=Micromonospora chersina TaxID=47854 RepID=UPI003CA76CD0